MKSLKCLGLILILFLAACQSATPTAAPELQTAEATVLPTSTQPPANTETAPAPETTQVVASTDEGYPAPPVQSTSNVTAPAPSGITGYPAPEEAIPWNEARNLILDGQVSQVTQFHSMRVILVLKDGRIVETVEPEIDEVFAVIDECGQTCSDIVTITE